jgi:hypothetical protein
MTEAVVEVITKIHLLIGITLVLTSVNLFLVLCNIISLSNTHDNVKSVRSNFKGQCEIIKSRIEGVRKNVSNDYKRNKIISEMINKAYEEKL